MVKILLLLAFSLTLAAPLHAEDGWNLLGEEASVPAEQLTNGEVLRAEALHGLDLFQEGLGALRLEPGGELIPDSTPEFRHGKATAVAAEGKELALRFGANGPWGMLSGSARIRMESAGPALCLEDNAVFRPETPAPPQGEASDSETPASTSPVFKGKSCIVFREGNWRTMDIKITEDTLYSLPSRFLKPFAFETPPEIRKGDGPAGSEGEGGDSADTEGGGATGSQCLESTGGEGSASELDGNGNDVTVEHGEATVRVRLRVEE